MVTYSNWLIFERANSNRYTTMKQVEQSTYKLAIKDSDANQHVFFSKKSCLKESTIFATN